MTLPARFIQVVRPEASAGVLAAAAMSAAIFTVTPLLLPDVASRLGVPIAATGVLSTAQVGSFAVAAFLAGRLLRPRRSLHYTSLAVIAVSSFASAIAPTFTVLVATRLLAGLGMGTLTWIAWADATRFKGGLGDVAAVGPVTAAIASPLLGWLVDSGGYPLVYSTLGLAALAVMVFRVDFADLPSVGRKVSSSRSNRVLLAAMLLISAGGSAVFIFSGAAAIEIYGMSTFTLSLAYSVNALTGVAATRANANRGRAGLWLALTAVSALAFGFLSQQLLLFVIFAVWGFAFWMGIPAVFRLLAERSLHPSERVGDAQAAMALGRVMGPLVGAGAVAVSFGALSITGGALMAIGAIAISAVEVGRSRSVGLAA